MQEDIHVDGLIDMDESCPMRRRTYNETLVMTQSELRLFSCSVVLATHVG